jgi:protein SCO1
VSRAVGWVAGVLVLLALGALATKAVLRPQLTGLAAPNVRLPDVLLIDDRGRPFTFAELRGTAYALFFGYTHCSDTCPVTLAKLERARLGLAVQQQRATAIVFVTVDPSRDTPARLHRYLTAFGPGLVGVTGTPQALKALGAALDVWSAQLGKGPKYQMGHTDAVFFVDPSGRVRTIHDWHDAQRDLTHDFSVLAG